MAVKAKSTSKNVSATAPKKSSTKPKTVAKKPVTKEKKVVAKATKKSVPVESSDKLAVVEVNGHQLLVKEGGTYEMNKLQLNKGDEMKIDKVLLYSDSSKTLVGKPYVDGATVKVTIDAQKKGKKLEGFKFKAKSRYRKSYGQRENITRLLVTSITA